MTLLAEGALDISSITPAISSLMSIGFTAWFSYYVITKTIPDQQKEHRDQLRAISETHANTIKELVAELRSGRESYDRWRMQDH